MRFHDVKNDSFFMSMLTWLVKWISGFLFSFVLSVMGMGLFSYGTISFVFVLVASQIFFWRFFSKSSLITVLLFDAAVLFTILMFRLYVILAPNI